MSNVLSLTKSLGLRGGNKGLQRALFLCAKELFGLTSDEYLKRWRPRASSDTGTLRGYMQPTAEALFDEWKRRRDPAWLYSHPEYKWDSLGCSTCQTHTTVASGISLLKKAGIMPRRIFDWGAGPGFSTLMLARNFPNAEVNYNECNDDLVAVFKWFAKHSGIRNVRHVPGPQGDYDLVQAYEIAEHISDPRMHGVGDPITETAKLLAPMASGSHFLHSSCWSAENNFFTLGHFLSYNVDGQVHSNSRTNGPFKRAMAKRGWSIIASGWNSRPNLYVKG